LPCLRYDKSTSKPCLISYPHNPITLGEHIRRRRMDLKMSQAAVARSLGVVEDCITYWENHRSEPKVSYYPRILTFLGYSPWQLDISTLQGRLKEYRYRHGLSYKKFGMIFGMDAAHIKKLEEGSTVPFRKTIAKLEHLLINPPRNRVIFVTFNSIKWLLDKPIALNLVGNWAKTGQIREC